MKTRNQQFLAVLLLLHFSFPLLFSQEPLFQNYRLTDGLPSDRVYDIIQDHQGYIWLATNFGISRFDGRAFQNFNTQDGLASNEIFELYEDSQFYLWMLTFNGKPNYFHRDIFYSPANNKMLANINLSGYISSIYEDKERKDIYLSAINGDIFKLNTSIQNSKNIIPLSKKGVNTHVLWKEANSKITLVTDEHIESIDSSGKVTKVASFSIPKGLTKSFMIGDSVLISSEKNIKIYDKCSKQIVDQKHFDFISSEIIRIHQHDKSLWLGTRDGVYKIPWPLGKDKTPSYQRYLSGHSVSGILIDREDNWWFSTLETGVHVVTNPQIIKYTKTEGMPQDKINCLSRDGNDQIWVGFHNNQYAVLNDGAIEHFKIPGLSKRENEIANIKQMEDGRTLVIGKELSLQIKNGERKLLCIATNDFIEDKFNNYWAGIRRIYHYRNNTIGQFFLPLEASTAERKALHYKSSDLKHQVTSRRINYFSAGLNGRIWCGSNLGLHYIDFGTKGNFISSTVPLLSDKITDLIYNKTKDLLWVATDARGVFLFHKNKLVSNINLEDGLSSPICTDLCMDEQGAIWVATINGLNKIERQDSNITLTNIYKISGLTQGKINAVEILKDKIYLGMDHGLAVIPQHLLSIPRKAPQIHLNSFKIEDSEYIYSVDRQFNHDQNDINFSFTGLSYQDRGNLQYQYILYGLDDQWENTSSTSALYKSLPPGSYTFEVKAINGRGISSEENAHLNFTIKKAFWQENWFLVLMVLSGLSVLIFLIKWRENKLKKRFALKNLLATTKHEKLELEKHFTDLKISALQLQMNPHFIFNALNTIKGYYASAQLQAGSQFINKFAKLLRLILEYSNKYIPLNREIELLQLYLELSQTRYPNAIAFTIDIPPTIDAEHIALPSMLIQPFVENAVIHGLVPKRGNGIISVRFELHNNCLVCEIQDNGIGRKAAGQINKPRLHNSMATQITRDRLQILTKNSSIADPFEIIDCENQSSNEKGTLVILKTPIKQLW